MCDHMLGWARRTDRQTERERERLQVGDIDLIETSKRKLFTFAMSVVVWRRWVGW